MNRAPEGTFGAAVAEVPVLDLLRVCRSLASFTNIVLIVFAPPLQFNKFTIGRFCTLSDAMLVLNFCYRRECLDE